MPEEVTLSVASPSMSASGAPVECPIWEHGAHKEPHFFFYTDDAVEQSLRILVSRYGTLKAQFTGNGFGPVMRTIVQVINGRSVIGANRQIFYVQQGSYDTHQSQLTTQQISLAELDTAIGNFMSSLDEMGLTNQVLICTHSDFCRTLTSNTSGGTYRAWGNHQFVMGGGIKLLVGSSGHHPSDVSLQPFSKESPVFPTELRCANESFGSLD